MNKVEVNLAIMDALGVTETNATKVVITLEPGEWPHVTIEKHSRDLAKSITFPGGRTLATERVDLVAKPEEYTGTGVAMMNSKTRDNMIDLARRKPHNTPTRYEGLRIEIDESMEDGIVATGSKI